MWGSEGDDHRAETNSTAATKPTIPAPAPAAVHAGA
jgi:hypothetical protein